MNESQLSQIKIEGFRSIKVCDLKLNELNVLIGANGAGKSNFIGFFRLIQQMLEGNLQRFVSKSGGPDSLLHFGRRSTPQLTGKFYFGPNYYGFGLEPTQSNQVAFIEEESHFGSLFEAKLGAGHQESKLLTEPGGLLNESVAVRMRQWRIYHFHDTSENAYVKQLQPVIDQEYLRPDARNLAPFLYRLKKHHSLHYERIVKTIRLVAPFFGDFHLKPNIDNGDVIELAWSEKGQDIPFKAFQLSDGTLRFICLATLLSQPEAFLPSTILIDEPELGLHPFAIHLLGGMLRSVSKNRQVIISTQSCELLNEFEPSDVIVANKVSGQSQFTRLNPDELKAWLDDYTLAELWQKNILGGRPSR